jgi:hypothetical protein
MSVIGTVILAQTRPIRSVIVPVWLGSPTVGNEEAREEKESKNPPVYHDFPSFVCILFLTAYLLSSRCASRGL